MGTLMECSNATKTTEPFRTIKHQNQKTFPGSHFDHEPFYWSPEIVAHKPLLKQ